jgi:hypothetical protein
LGVSRVQLEDQVCSLELAKLLKLFDIKQDSLFHWHHFLIGDWQIVNGDDCPIRSYTNHENYSAFTVAELGRILPGAINVGGIDFYLTMDCDRHVYYTNLKNTEEYWNFNYDENDNEADQRAKMIIHLKEYKLI